MTDTTNRKTNTSIWVTFALPGIHKYPNAPDEVAYLREPHRHLFKFKVLITVFHDDREIEFHMFLNYLKSLFATSLELDYQSCEMLAGKLLEKVLAKYDCTNRLVVVEVSEDGECGAIVQSSPT